MQNKIGASVVYLHQNGLQITLIQLHIMWLCREIEEGAPTCLMSSVLLAVVSGIEPSKICIRDVLDEQRGMAKQVAPMQLLLLRWFLRAV